MPHYHGTQEIFYAVLQECRKARRKDIQIMREKFMRFMQGRYGMDGFSRFLLAVGAVCLLLSSLFHVRFLNYVCWVLLIYLYFRMFSRNIQKRYAEGVAYERAKAKVKAFFKGDRSMIDQAKMYRIFKCPKCSQKIRVPRGKGKIEITCPKCSGTFRKRT